MFESKERLAADVARLLDAIREGASARYACVLDPTGLLFESGGEGAPADRAVRGFLEARLAALFALPERMRGAGPEEDVFVGWDDDDVLVAFLNGRVALALFCENAVAARLAVERPFLALADRLLRWRPAWRLDEHGRGLFVGRSRVDWIEVSRA